MGEWRAESGEWRAESGERRVGKGQKKSGARKDSALSLGWEVGFEPTTSRSTIWRSNQLNYAHHATRFTVVKSGAKVRTFSKLAKYFFIFVCKLLVFSIVFLRSEAREFHLFVAEEAREGDFFGVGGAVETGDAVLVVGLAFGGGDDAVALQAAVGEGEAGDFHVDLDGHEAGELDVVHVEHDGALLCAGQAHVDVLACVSVDFHGADVALRRGDQG